MSSKPETKYIGRIHQKLPSTVYHMKNNNPYVGGVPDVYYSGFGGDLWVEYKYLDPLPVKVPIRPSALLSKLQTEWLNGRYDEGRKVAVIIGCKTGGVVLTDKAWCDDLSIGSFNLLLKSNADLANWIREQVTI